MPNAAPDNQPDFHARRRELARQFQERWEADPSDPCDDLHAEVDKLNLNIARQGVRNLRTIEDQGIIASWLRAFRRK